jgi:D-glycero-alpha-D-manno-heptose-7-phosphate kinase
MLIGRSPVRISFAGGGTDLPAYYERFGGAVLSATINKYFYTILGRRTDKRVQVISSDLRVFETWQDIAAMKLEGSGLEIPLAVLKDLSTDVSVDLFLASEIPPGTGLGSSASVCVGILKTLTAYLNRPLSTYDLADRAFHITRDTLRRHGGRQDEYACAYGGLNFITFDRDGSTRVEPLKLDRDLMKELQNRLMLFFTGSARHSDTILEEQEKSTSASKEVTVEALHRIRVLADNMRVALESGDLSTFGALMDEAWQTKKKVSEKISTSRIDHIYELAQQHGASGGKITGAGGGGFLLLCCEPDCQNAVRTHLMAEGLQEMAFSFEPHGAQVIVNDPFIDGDERAGSQWVFVPGASAF